MIEFKPTPGEWEISKDDNEEYWRGNIHYNVGPAIGIYDEDDAKLIANAGNTYHATGMTPSQLAERVKVLEDALQSLNDRFRKCYSKGMYFEEVCDSFYQEIITKALAK